MRGPISEVLTELGSDGIVQLLVEGGPHVAAQFHRAGLVDQYVCYVAPMFFGGDDGAPIFSGFGAGTISDAFRGTLDRVQQLGGDVRLDVRPVRTKAE